MKNTMIHNLVKHLPGLKHIKSEFYRGFVLYTFLISAFLTLGVGQVWGEAFWPYAGFYEVYMTYSYSGNNSNYTFYASDNNSSQSVDLGILTADFKINDLYLKCYKNTGDWSKYGNICGALMIYNTGSGDNEYQPTWGGYDTDKGWDDGYQAHKRELTKTSCNKVIASYNSGASGSYTAKLAFKMWGSDDNGSDCGDIWWISNNSNNYKFKYKIAPPAVKSNSVAISATNTAPGSGTGLTSGSPIILISGMASTLTITATQNRTDANSALWCKFGTGSYSSTTTYNIAANTLTTNQTLALNVKYRNNSAGLDGSETTTTIYYKWAAPAPAIVLSSVSPSSSIVAGNDITLVGTRANSTSNISFQYTTDDGSSWTDITPKTTSGTSTKTITWTIPDAHGATQTFKFRAKLAEATPIYSAKSDGVSVYNTKTIHVKNSNNWPSLYLYAWDGSSHINGAWPGKSGVGNNGLSCTQIGGGLWWDVVITSNVATFVLNRNLSGDDYQTEDLSYSTYTHDRCIAVGNASGKKKLPNTAVSCLSAPTVTTASVTPTVNNKATLGGNVTALGNDKVTSFGYYYSTNSALSSSNLGVGTRVEVGTAKMSTGAYSNEQTGLTGGTTYYVIAYATNGLTTSYGSKVSFTTPYKVTITNPTGGTFSATGTQYVSSTLAVTCTAATGYTFSSWSAVNCSMTSTSTSSGVTTATLTPTADNATLTATYTENMTTVNLVATPTGKGTFTIGGASVTSTTAGVATTRSVTAVAGTGYRVNTSATVWTKSNSYINLNNVKANPVTVTGAGSGGTSTLTATFTPKTYTITLHEQGATTHGSPSDGGTITVTYDATTNLSKIAAVPEKSGYTFDGYYANEGCTGPWIIQTNTYFNWDGTYINSSTGVWQYDGNLNLYAKWVANQYTVTLDVDEENKGTIAGATTSQNIYYNDPTVTVPNRPTAANGYALDGYYTDHNGAGTKVINANGTWIASVAGYTDGSKRWIHADNVTLYAYYKKAAITNIALSPGEIVAPGVTVTATATISPTPVAPTIVCWKLLRSNGSLYSDDCFTPASGNSVSFTAPASGSYKIATILRLGSSCGAGEVIDSVVTNLVLATDHTVTVKYMCGDDVIKEQTTTTGKPLEWTSITAPTIVGYTFSKWRAGDAVTIQGADANGEKASATINYKANYDGKLTAIYTKKRVIYFNNTLGWSSVYVYFYKNNSYWDLSGNNWGTGANTGYEYTSYPYSEGQHGQMLPVTEGSSIYYFDAEAEGVNASYTNVAFTEGNQHGYGYFSNTKVVRRSDYQSGTLPMFVPLTGLTPATYNSNAQYYNEGYWMNYPENTGYWLKVFDAKNDGNELYSIPFEFTADKTLPMEISINLEAKKTYYYQVYRADGVYISVDGTMKSNDSGDTEKGQSPWTIFGSRPRTGLITTAAGDYTFILGYANSGGYNYIMSVKYPAQKDDYRLVYTDVATADFWSQNAAHTSSWCHPSRVIEKRANAIDTISFFIAKGQTPKIKVQQISSINVGTGAISWANVGDWSTDYDSVSAAGVYNFIIQQDGDGNLTLSSITKVEPYTGDYYIRVDAASNKWVNYTTDHDHLMTYTEFSENRSTNTFGPLYSHYKAKWCVRGTNVKFVIANDYSPCISDTLTKDKPNTFDNIDDYGNLKTSGGDATSDKYSANIRFMWNRHTNKIGRAYVASATTPARQFLVLKSCTEIRNSDGSELNGTGESHAANDYRAIFKDNQDFIYERMIKIQPTTRAKLYACYGYDPYDVSKAQFFRGEYDNGDCEDADNSIQIIGGSGSDFYTVRLIYDFKTNRLICAWLPDGTIINSNVEIDADVMVIRDHQESAECITFSGSGKLSEVKTVYGVLRLNRWTLNNRARGLDGEDDQNPEHCSTASAISTYHPVLATGDQKSLYERALYFISFPFDVKLSEVFGFGTYGVDWVISEYNGLRRAKNGYFYDNCFNDDCTNWDYIWDRTGVTLEAYKGYLLSLEIDNMAYDNTDFWPNNISQKELYFPSASAMSTITTTNVTMPGLGDEYECKINYNKPEGSNPEGDRRMKDSYWRCIGTPSYATYGTILKKDGPSGSTIEWQSDRSWRATVKNFPFLYEWNVDDNSISVQATTRYNFKPTHAYLVQNGNAIYWTAVSATPSSIVRRQREEDNQEYYWRLTLEQDGVFQDQTYIRMTDNEQVTDTFDFGQDLVKESKVGYSNVYSVLGYERLAANSMPLHTENTTIIPLGVKALTAGEFTFDLPDGANGVGITLVDNETGEHTNLSTGMSYTIALGQGTYENRFYLEIAKIKDVATGTEEIGEPSKSDVRKVMINGILYIVRGDQIFDALGNRVE